jgi:pyrroline-5-carboxylate reductase
MRVGLIGAGNMARALARGWGDPVLCSDSGSGRARALVDELGGEATSNAEVGRLADVVVLCHKPYQLRAVAAEVAPHARVVVSVLGGTNVGALEDAYAEAQVFRMIPNTAVEVRQGTTIYSPRPGADGQVERQVIELFERVGTVVSVGESAMSAATAITGVGPAYQALLAEAQVEAALRYGLPAAVASRLVVETMAGAAALIAHREYDTLAVRREVTSPGGTTAQGLDALERAGIRTAFQDAMDAVVGGGRA